MKVLVACEFSGVVRDAFTRAGHDATSCDLLETESVGKHHRGDVREILEAGWDLMIAHPPCTYLAASGARWWKDRKHEQEDAISFVRTLLEAPIPRIALENPIGILSTRIRPPDQIIQPWMFGHPESKATCLWLKRLPPLMDTLVDEKREARVHRESPGKDRWKRRSRTLPGIASAMAMQWGHLT